MSTGATGSPLQATAHAESAPTGVTLTPATGGLAFGNIQAATTSTPQSVQISNSGSTAVDFAGITGDNGPGVFVSSGTGCAWNQHLDPGTSCQVTVTATPTIASNFARTLTVTLSNGGVIAIPETVTGVAAASPIKLTPASGVFAFGTVSAGSTSNPQNVMVTNTGNAAISITGVSTNSAAFVISSPGCDWVPILPPGGSCWISMQAKPPENGLYRAALRMTLQGLSDIVIAESVTGGTPAATARSNWLDFGAVNVGAISPILGSSIVNAGSSPITISAVTSNTAAVRVSAHSGCWSNVVLKAGDGCTLRLVAAPSVVGVTAGFVEVSFTGSLPSVRVEVFVSAIPAGATQISKQRVVVLTADLSQGDELNTIVINLGEHGGRVVAVDYCVVNLGNCVDNPGASPQFEWANVYSRSGATDIIVGTAASNPIMSTALSQIGQADASDLGSGGYLIATGTVNDGTNPHPAIILNGYDTQGTDNAVHRFGQLIASLTDGIVYLNGPTLVRVRGGE